MAEPKKAEPSKTEPSKAEPTKAEPSKVEPNKVEPSKAEPKKVEPSKAEPAKAEPQKREPSKAEPTKAEPAAAQRTELAAAKQSDPSRPKNAEPAEPNKSAGNNNAEGRAGDRNDGTTDRTDAESSGKPEWLKVVEAGNEFNREREPHYTAMGGANEVHVGPKSDKGQYARVDSYVPGKEIVSRKNTQLSEVQPETGIRYLEEFDKKYKAGTKIADTPTNRRDLGDDLIGTELEGEMILEVPPQDGDVPIEVLKKAEDLDITIRDSEGHVYELDDSYTESGNTRGDESGEGEETR